MTLLSLPHTHTHTHTSVWAGHWSFKKVGLSPRSQNVFFRRLLFCLFFCRPLTYQVFFQSARIAEDRRPVRVAGPCTLILTHTAVCSWIILILDRPEAFLSHSSYFAGLVENCDMSVNGQRSSCTAPPVLILCVHLKIHPAEICYVQSDSVLSV